MRPWLIALVTSQCFRAAVTQDSGVWIVPTEPGPSGNFGANLVWTEGSTVTLEWNTSLSYYEVELYQQGIDPPSGLRVGFVTSFSTNGAGNNEYRWLVQTYDSDLNFSPVYFFWLNPDGGGHTSHYFNITPAESESSSTSTSRPASILTTTVRPVETSSASPTSSVEALTTTNSDTGSSSIAASRATSSSASSKPSSTPPIPTSTASDATTAPPPSSTPTQPPASETDSDSSSQTTLKVGFGVGLGVGIPLVLLAGAWLGLKVWKHRRATARSQSPSVPLTQVQDRKGYSHSPPYTDSGAPGRGYHEADAEARVYEVAGWDRKPVELGTER